MPPPEARACAHPPSSTHCKLVYDAVQAESTWSDQAGQPSRLPHFKHMICDLFDRFTGEVMQLWTQAVSEFPCQELYNYFFSSGFIKPKKKASKPKPTPQQMEQYYKTLNLRRPELMHANGTFGGILLGRPGAKAAAVKKAYRQLALRFHPDKNQDSAALNNETGWDCDGT